MAEELDLYTGTLLFREISFTFAFDKKEFYVCIYMLTNGKELSFFGFQGIMLATAHIRKIATTATITA